MVWLLFYYTYKKAAQVFCYTCIIPAVLCWASCKGAAFMRVSCVSVCLCVCFWSLLKTLLNIADRMDVSIKYTKVADNFLHFRYVVRYMAWKCVPIEPTRETDKLQLIMSGRTAKPLTGRQRQLRRFPKASLVEGRVDLYSICTHRFAGLVYTACGGM